MIVAGVEFFFYFVLCDIRFVEYNVFQFIVLASGGCCLVVAKCKYTKKSKTVGWLFFVWYAGAPPAIVSRTGYLRSGFFVCKFKNYVYLFEIQINMINLPMPA